MPTQKDFETLRNLIVVCICRGININNMRTFHGVDMIKNCARGFLDEEELLSMSLVESMITIKMSFRESTGLWPKADISKSMKIITL